MLIKSLDSPLYIKKDSIHFPIAKIQAMILINSRFLFYFALVICPDTKAILVIIIFSDRP